MQRRFKLEWDEDELARAFKVAAEDIREYLTDGRRVSFIILKEGWCGKTLAGV